MSHTSTTGAGISRCALVATLGSDFQRELEPFTHEIVELATRMGGDQHRAAMRLLVDRQGRRPNAMEQQLIVAALAELQERTARGLQTRAHAAVRGLPDSNQYRHVHPLQVHQALDA